VHRLIVSAAVFGAPSSFTSLAAVDTVRMDRIRMERSPRVTDGRRNAMGAAKRWRAAGAGVIVVLCLVLASTAHSAFPGENGKLAFQECPFRCGISTIDQSGLEHVTVGGVFGPIGSQVIVNDASPTWSARRRVDRVPAQRAAGLQPVQREHDLGHARGWHAAARDPQPW
jgi:hypothetical protein